MPELTPVAPWKTPPTPYQDRCERLHRATQEWQTELDHCPCLKGAAQVVDEYITRDPWRPDRQRPHADNLAMSASSSWLTEASILITQFLTLSVRAARLCFGSCARPRS